MSSAASNRYQSRLFNFVYKRSRRLTERLNRAWQNVTSWIAPVVMHPAQVLHEAVHKSLPQLPKADKSDSPPTVDTPVKNVLLLVEMPSDEDLSLTTTATPINFLGWLGNKLFPKTNKLLHGSEKLAHTPLNRPLVRGIASDISNRTLVLVTPQNDIVDILDSQEQQRLQARIINEVAQYWRYQRLLAASADAIERSQLPAHQSFLSAPGRLFNSIATWIPATGKLSKTNDSLTDHIDEQGELIFATGQAIAFLDRNLAQFEANHLVPVAENTTKTNRFQIQVLIWAAIDYFFGDRSPEKLASKPPGNQTLPNTDHPYLPYSHQEELADPWLTIGDLFGQPKLANQPLIEQNPSSSFAQLPDNPSLTIVNKSSLRNLLNRFRKIPHNHKKSPALLVKNSQTAKEVIKVKPQKITPAASKLSTTAKLSKQTIKVKPQKTFTPAPSKLSTTAQPSKQTRANNANLDLRTSVVSTTNNQIDHTPDWIETEATAMGYIKHPLEQLLAWLDAAMLWLEDILVKIWQRLQKLLIGK